MLTQQFLHALMDAIEGGFVEQSASHAGLIRNDDDEISRVGQSADGFARSGQKGHIGGIADVSAIFDDRAIAIEKYGFGTHVSSPRMD
jgi:hypothetical protein